MDDWYKALTLTERAALLRMRAPKLSRVDAGSGQRRLKAWRAQAPFNQRDFFARRLATDGINEGELLRLLSESENGDSGIAAADLPWRAALEDAFAENSQSESGPFCNLSDLRGFLVAVRPLINRALWHLHAEAKALTNGTGAECRQARRPTARQYL